MTVRDEGVEVELSRWATETGTEADADAAPALDAPDGAPVRAGGWGHVAAVCRQALRRAG